MSRVFEEVQAALLNSEGDPGEELMAALEAVAYFGMVECEVEPEGLADLLRKAITAAQERQKKEFG